MPQSHVRLAAGRENMTDEAHALCFLAGANSIFCGEKLLTTPNPAEHRDRMLLDSLGMRPMVETEGGVPEGANFPAGTEERADALACPA